VKTSDLPRLFDYAKAGGAPAEFLSAIAAELYAIMLEPAVLRRLQMLERARRLAADLKDLEAKGHKDAVAILKRRLRLSNSHFYRLLNLSRELGDHPAPTPPYPPPHAES
jgi:hypothetical protein